MAGLSRAELWAQLTLSDADTDDAPALSYLIAAGIVMLAIVAATLAGLPPFRNIQSACCAAIGASTPCSIVMMTAASN